MKKLIGFVAITLALVTYNSSKHEHTELCNGYFPDGWNETRSQDGFANFGTSYSDFTDAVNRIESIYTCLLYTSPSPRDATLSRMPSSA